MLKLTKTGIGLLTRQYRSVLKKCWLINVGLFTLGAIIPTVTMVDEAMANIVYYDVVDAGAVTVNTLSTLNRVNGFLINHIDESTGTTPRVVTLDDAWQGGGELVLSSWSGTVETYLRYNSFKLNNSSIVADGIRASVAQGSNNLITAGGVYSELQKYYTKTAVDAADYSKYFDVNSTGAAATAVTTDSIAIGSGAVSGLYDDTDPSNIIDNLYTVAIGKTAHATGRIATAIGFTSTASGTESLAIGTVAAASGNYSTALGSKAKAYNANSVALGSNSVANADDTVSVGYYTDDNHYLYRKIVNVADGSDDHDVATVGQLNNYYTKYGFAGKKHLSSLAVYENNLSSLAVCGASPRQGISTFGVAASISDIALRKGQIAGRSDAQRTSSDDNIGFAAANDNATITTIAA